MGEEAGRAQWGRQIEFVLTMVGYAVGLGNVWRFPYLCYKNGGGAFLIPYIVCLVCIGIPMFALETAFGQFGGKGPLSIWSINPAMKGIGFSLLICSSLVFIYYNIIIAWALNFLVASFSSHLPWIDCKECACLLYTVNPANNLTQLTDDDLDSMAVNNSLGRPCPNIGSSAIFSPSEVYYKFEVLQDSGTIQEMGGVQWPLLLGNFVAYAIILLVLYRGIQSLGKVVYFTAIFPYILLTILLIRSAMLEGAIDGIEYYLTPRWERLKDAEVWSDAAVQIFFSLSACMGGLIAMSSYNKFDNNIIRDAFMIPIINCCTSLYAGFVVFSTLGYMAHVKGVGVADVTEGGPGLAFVVYPEALGQMPVSTLWAIMFFFMLCILGFSTQFSAAETIMTSVIDEFPHVFSVNKARPLLFRIFVCLTAFILGIPMVTRGGSHLLDLVDGAVLGFPMLFVGLFEYLTIVHIYGYSNFAEDIRTMLGRPPMFYHKATWTVIAPVCLVAVIVFKAYNGVAFEVPWAGAIYYLIVVFILMWIPLYFFIYTCPRGLWQLMRPEQQWKDRRLQGNRKAEELEQYGGERVLDRNSLQLAQASPGTDAAGGAEAGSNPQTERKGTAHPDGADAFFPYMSGSDSESMISMETKSRLDHGIENAAYLVDESADPSEPNQNEEKY